MTGSGTQADLRKFLEASVTRSAGHWPQATIEAEDPGVC